MLSSTCSFVMIDNILGYSFTLLFWEEILIFKTHITNKRETCAALADASHRGGAQECCLLGRCLLTSLPWFGVQDSQAGAFRLATQLCPLCLLQRTSNNAMTAQFRFEILSHFSHHRWSLQEHEFWDVEVTSDFASCFAWPVAMRCFSHLH